MEKFHHFWIFLGFSKFLRVKIGRYELFLCYGERS